MRVLRRFGIGMVEGGVVEWRQVRFLEMEKGKVSVNVC